MEKVKVQKGTTIKTISAVFKKDAINAGWKEVKEPAKKMTGVSSSVEYGKNKY